MRWLKQRQVEMQQQSSRDSQQARPESYPQNAGSCGEATVQSNPWTQTIVESWGGTRIWSEGNVEECHVHSRYFSRNIIKKHEPACGVHVVVCGGVQVVCGGGCNRPQREMGGRLWTHPSMQDQCLLQCLVVCGRFEVARNITSESS